MDRLDVRVGGQLNGKQSLGAVVCHTFSILEEKCVNIVTANQVKKTNYAFCKQIYTPQTYGRNEPKQRSPPKQKPKWVVNKKTYGIRQSANAKKPHLDKDKHVRKYQPTKPYRKKLQCFICNSTAYLARDYATRSNSQSKEAVAIECTNLNLIRTDEDILIEESIWSIFTIVEQYLEDIPPEYQQ